MIENAEIGKRYRVINDTVGFFSKGEIVVSIEDDDTPYCVRESDYIPGNNVDDYNRSKYSALTLSELEEIESEDK